MILVDTSVWIDYFNGVQSPHTDLLDSAIIEGTVAIGDLIFLEILQGIRSDRDYRKTRQLLLLIRNKVSEH
jgi:predicted nucleic acid-binding protein